MKVYSRNVKGELISWECETDEHELAIQTVVETGLTYGPVLAVVEQKPAELKAA